MEEEIPKIKEALRKAMKEMESDSVSVKYRDKTNVETLIITLHDYIDED